MSDGRPPRRRRPQAGKRLRAELDAALARQGEAEGVSLVFDLGEMAHVMAACQNADHAELLQRRLDEEVAGQNRPTILVQLTGAIRLANKAVGEHLALIGLAELAPLQKSRSNSDAGRADAAARWGHDRPRPLQKRRNA